MAQSQQFKRGDSVRLKTVFLATKSSEVQRAFTGILTIAAIQGGKVYLSNGKNTGLCRISCSVNDIVRA